MDDQRSTAAQTAILTAAAGGIGAATATALALAGFDLVLVDVDGDGVDRVAAGLAGSQEGTGSQDGTGRSVVAVEADVTDEAAVASVVAQAVDRFGRIDGLVNLVGAGRAGAKAPDVALTDWSWVLDRTLTSTFLMCRAVIPVMEAQGGGAVVNVASMAGIRGMYRSPAYCAAKGGVISLTKALALDHGPAGVRVNCVAPGAVATPALRRGRSDADIAAIGRGSLTGRVAEPEEIAAAISWLLTPAASYVMGQTIEVDGGLPTPA